MRTLVVAPLALVLVALPAAQAAACGCDAEGWAESPAAACACCGPAAETCCCGSESEGTTQRLQQDCPCSLPAPQTSESPDIEVPAPVAGTEVPRDGSAPLAAVYAHPPLAARIDPHPEVLLPLLL